MFENDSIRATAYITCSDEEFAAFMVSGGEKMLQAMMRKYRVAGNEDLYQELCLTAAHAIAFYDMLRIDVKLTTYVWECCKKVFMMEHRRNTTKKRVPASKTISFEDFCKELFSESATDEEDFRPAARKRYIYQKFSYSMDQTVEKREARELLQEMLDEAPLTSQQRIILRQTMEGVPQSRIGKDLGFSQAKVSVQYNRALSLLRETVAAHKAMAV